MPTFAGTDTDADLVEMIADLATTVTWKTSTLNAIVHDVTRSHELEMAGMALEDTIEVVVRKADFTSTLPALGDTVTINSVSFRIRRIVQEPDQAAWRLLCEEISP